MNIPDKYLSIKDSYEVVIFGFKIYTLTQKHKADPGDTLNWWQKLLAKADYLSALPLAMPAFDNIQNCLNEIKDPAKVKLIGEAISETLDLPNDNMEARIKKIVLATTVYASELEEAFA